MSVNFINALVAKPRFDIQMLFVKLVREQIDTRLTRDGQTNVDRRISFSVVDGKTSERQRHDNIGINTYHQLTAVDKSPCTEL